MPTVQLLTALLLVILAAAGDLDAADTHRDPEQRFSELERVLAERRQTLGPGHPDVARTLLELASVARQRTSLAPRTVGLLQEALAIMDQRQDAFDPQSRADVLSRLGDLLTERSDHAAAASVFRQALGLRLAGGTPGGAGVGFLQCSLGSSLVAGGSVAEGLATYGQGVSALERALGATNSLVLLHRETYARLLKQHQSKESWFGTRAPERREARRQEAAVAAALAKMDGPAHQPLLLAARYGQPDEVRRLLAAGADLNAKDGAGRTALHLAAAAADTSEHLDVIRLLLDRGAFVSARGEGGKTPLHAAALAGRLPAAELLLSRGANVDLRDGLERTALHAAVWEAQLPVVRLLVERGADVNATSRGGGRPLHMAAMSGHRPEHADVVAYLIERGATVDRPDDGGETPLLVAVQNGRYDLAAQLLLAGADPNLKSYAGLTPLGLARSKHDVKLVELLSQSPQR